MNPQEKYPVSARLLHWIMAIIILSMLFLGVSMIQSFLPWQNTALSLHKSFGTLVFLLVIFRLLNRLRFQAPALPKNLPNWQKFSGHASHVLLYMAMIGMPLSGWFMQSAAGLSITPFGLFTLPQIISEDIKLYSLFRELHGIIAWLFFALILLHIAAALYHKLIRRDGVLDAMAFDTSHKMSSKHRNIVFNIVLSFLISLIISLILTVKISGFQAGFILQWSMAFLYTWVVIFPAVLIFAPVVKKITNR